MMQPRAHIRRHIEVRRPQLRLVQSAAPASARSRYDRAALLALMALSFGTYGAMIGNYPGESDCTLFLYGIWRWLSYGPRALEIYDKVFSPGYYWVAAHLLRFAGTPPARFALILNCFSLAAGLAAGPLLYLIARRFAGPLASFMATALFLLSPSVWWLNIEPHPQGPAMALFFAAVYCWLRAWRLPATACPNPEPAAGPVPIGRLRAAWIAACLLFISASLLLRADGVLMFGVLPAVLLATAFPLRLTDDDLRREWLRRMTVSFGVLLLSVLIFFAARRVMLQESIAAAQAAADKDTGGYIMHFVAAVREGGVGYVFKQLLPEALAPGFLPLLFALAGMAIFYFRRPREWTYRRLLLLAGWALPGYLFWFLVHGNNIRHVAAYSFVLFLIGCEGWRLVGRRALSLGAAAAVLLGLFIIPPSSNLTLYASANVPASARMLHQRQRELRELAGRLVVEGAQPTAAPVPACYLGSYTVPYVIEYVLERVNRLDSGPGSPIRMLVTPQGFIDIQTVSGGRPSFIRFFEIYDGAQLEVGSSICATAVSLEYTDPLHRARFFGQEWSSVPFGSHFFKAQPVTPAALLQAARQLKIPWNQSQGWR
jgi:hypothetical protein